MKNRLIDKNVSRELKLIENLSGSLEALEAKIGRDALREFSQGLDDVKKGVLKFERSIRKDYQNLIDEFQQMMGSMDGVFWLREPGRVLYVSPGYEVVYGRSCQSLYKNPQSFLDSILDEDREAYESVLQKSDFLKHGKVEFEYRIRRPNGEIRWIHVTNTPLEVEQGEVLRYSGWAQDITERKQREEELEAGEDGPEEADYELKMINRQLETAIARANDMALRAETASRSKTEFLANMSHEIRTPLNAVMGMITMMEDTPLDGDQEDYLNTIRYSSETLLNIINDILDFSKIEAGRVDLESIPFDLPRTLHETRNMLAYQAEEKGLELAIECADQLPHTVVGDPTRLRQIFVNLVGNAIKFTSEGFVKIRATLDKVEGSLVCVRFEVKDSGIGIPKDKMHRLFRPFSQAESSTTRKFGGTGLGLVISNRLCELMGSSIKVESEEGVGTTFSFKINFAVDKAQNNQEAESGSQTVSMSDVSDQKRKELSILLAEDNATNRKVALLLLKKCGYRADIVVNGLEVIDAFAGGKDYDVVLMDMQMPEMDGLDATRALREQFPKERQPHVIALTASASKQHRDMCLDAGMDDFLSKPIRVNELKEKLDAACLL